MTRFFGIEKWTAVLPDFDLREFTIEASDKNQLLEKIKKYKYISYEHYKEMANIAESLIKLFPKPPEEVKVTPDGFELIGVRSITKPIASKLGRWWIAYCESGKLVVKVII